MAASRKTAEQWGERVAAVWYLGGFLVLFACAIAQVGPSAWVAAWQVRHWGYDNVLLSFLPGFGGLVAPFVALACLPRRPATDSPAWASGGGARRALWAAERPKGVVLPPARVAHRLGVFARVCAGLAVTALLVGGLVAWAMMRPGDPPPGSPLPQIALDDAVRSPGLPSPARLTDAMLRRRHAWEHDEVLRRTTIHDVYVALAGPAWHEGDPVAAVALFRGELDLDGPLEGTLSRGLPAWLVGAMREAGVAVSDAPLVLTRARLGGVVPAPDMADAAGPLILGGAFGFVLGLMAFSCGRARRKLLRAAPT